MYASYVALGDSFTEGLDDRRPDGSFRGWADRVADELAARSPGFRYANLAVRGRRMAQIREQQLPRALEMAPELITVAAGGNDIIGFRCDVPALSADMHDLLVQLTGTGADVLVFTGFNPTGRLPAGRLLAARAAAFNVSVAQSAAELGARVVDLWAMTALYRDSRWAADRLHLSTAGHELVAAQVLRALALAPGQVGPGQAAPGGAAPGGAAPGGAQVDGQVDDGQDVPARWVDARRADVDWARTYFAPWVGRKVRGRSTGDQVVAKLPELTPLHSGCA